MEAKHILQLNEVNQAYKEMDEIYHNYAKIHDLSNTAFLVLYALWERGAPYPQHELCEDWSYPVQTINSAIKVLERQGLVGLVFVEGSRKNKAVQFTPVGYELARDIIEPFIQAEQNSFLGLSEQEREMLLSTIKKHISIFRNEVNLLLSREQKESPTGGTAGEKMSQEEHQ